MANPAPTPDFPLPSLANFRPVTPLAAAQLPELVGDFFSWLEHEWQLPVISPPLEFPSPKFPEPLLNEGMYTKADLRQLWNWTRFKVNVDLIKFRIPAVRIGQNDKIPADTNVYRGRDLLPLVQYWEWQRLTMIVDAHWQRFFKEACGSCFNCSRYNSSIASRWLYCDRSKNYNLRSARKYFFSVLKGIRTYGSVSAWWQLESKTKQPYSYTPLRKDSDLILFYLMDRHYVALSWEEVAAIFPFNGIISSDFIRPWRSRRPSEYATFLQILTQQRRPESTHQLILSALAMLLLQYGLGGVEELSRQLTTEEKEEALRQRRLITLHLYADIYLPYPLNSDIRLGHLLLDTLRTFMWQYNHTHVPSAPRWGAHHISPFSWYFEQLNAIDEVLCSHLWSGCWATIESDARRPGRADVLSSAGNLSPRRPSWIGKHVAPRKRR